MKVVFISNHLNHHQLPMAKEFFEMFGDDYRFIATKRILPERIALGYEDIDKKYPFVLTTYNGIKNKRKALKLINESEIVIVGSAPESLVQRRIWAGKLTFRYAERPLKLGNNPIKIFPRWVKWHLLSPQNKAVHMLCASAYTASDYAKFGMYKNRSYEWGYFPETKTFEDLNSLFLSKELNSITWAGRMIDWKHPELAILLAKKMKTDGYKFKLNIIGTGEMEEKIHKMIEQEKLDDCVNLHGSMPPEKVREHMEKSQIYLFTSDFQEGWGAVLNEAMNSGCAVVASHAIGSVPFLINDGENGVIFRNEDIDDLYKKVKGLIDNPQTTEQIGRNAYKTISDEWNAKSAAERFLKLADDLICGRETQFKSGPCSKAALLENDWL